MAVCVTVALAACGDDDDSASGATTEAAEETTTETTEAPTTTEEETTTIRRTTTTQRATTTTAPDPLTEALVAAGYQAPTDETREALETTCSGFTAGDPEAINAVAERASEEPDFLTLVQTAFGVLCPENSALVGVAVMPNGEPVFPGYPRIVDVGTIDSRVASAYEGQLIDGQVVALAPGVYTPYNPNVPNLVAYLNGPNDGDCVMRDQFFPETGGSCWTGVQPGPGEQ